MARRARVLDLVGRRCRDCGATAEYLYTYGTRKRHAWVTDHSACVPLCTGCANRASARAKIEAVRHGTRAGYRAGCRCLGCTLANRVVWATHSGRTAATREWGRRWLSRVQKKRAAPV